MSNATNITETLATETFSSSLFGDRTIKAYRRHGHSRGEYAVRLILPAGEMVQNEVLYAYEGPSIGQARAAWKATVAKWRELYEGVTL